MNISKVYIEKENLKTKAKEVIVSRYYCNEKNYYKATHHYGIKRLVKYLENKDKDTYKCIETGVKIITYSKGGKFNEPSVTIFKKDGFGAKGKDFRLRAVKRLAKYLEAKEPESIYCGTFESHFEGHIIYHICGTTFEYRTNEDKQKLLRNKIRGQKATLTKTINAAKKIKKSFEITLFPESYIEDENWIKNIKKIKEKRNKINLVKKLSIGDIQTYTKELDVQDQKNLDKFISTVI